jgi:HD-GYP domain-containing protein (c-di-GMP phosphodiesterase class II)
VDDGFLQLRIERYPNDLGACPIARDQLAFVPWVLRSQAWLPTTGLMRFSLRERLLPLLVLGTIVALVPAALVATVGGVQVGLTARIHFLAVGFTALVAAIGSGVLTVAGVRRADARTVLVGGAFAVMAALLALHGLSTPGFLVGSNGVVELTGGLTLPIGGAILALSVVPLPGRLRHISTLLLVEGISLALIIALGVSAILVPALVPSVPAANSRLALGLLASGLAIYVVLGWRALRTFLLTQRGLDLAVVVGLVWLATALVPALTMGWSDLGWWMGHEIELDGILLIGVAVAFDLARATQSRPLAGDLRASELVTDAEHLIGAHVHALLKRLAEKDAYTEQHARRVALLAVQVGELLHLSPSRLRTLAVGGLVHDIGKLSVPDSILKKPASLTDDEYNIIRKHPEWGHSLLKQVGDFPVAVRRLVLDHHERLDGHGYPRHLSSDQLSLDTRILTVCDVYDALITPRVYRPAWTQQDAINELHARAGTAYDPLCLNALRQVLLATALDQAPAATDKQRRRARNAAWPAIRPTG